MATGTVKMIPSRIRTDDQRRTFLGREGSCSRSGHDDGRREAEKAAEEAAAEDNARAAIKSPRGFSAAQTPAAFDP
jgi:hypothetical protein